MFREVASGAKTDRAQLRRVVDQLDVGDVLMVRPAGALHPRPVEYAGGDHREGSRFPLLLGDTWADTTTPHGRLMLTVLSGP